MSSRVNSRQCIGRMQLSIRAGLSLAFLLLLDSTAAADSSLRLKAGATTLQTEESIHEPGFTLGGTIALARWAPSIHLAFVPQFELLLARRHISTGDSDSITIDALEIPLLLRTELTLGDRSFYAIGGVYGNILLRAQQTSSDGTISKADMASTVDGGLLVAGGFEVASFLSGQLFLEARYQRGYRPLLHESDRNQEVLSFLLGYGLRSTRDESGSARNHGQALALKGGLVATRFLSLDSPLATYSLGVSFGGALSLARVGSWLALVPQFESYFVHRSASDGQPANDSLTLESIDVSMLLRAELALSRRSLYGIAGIYGSVLLSARRVRDGRMTGAGDDISSVDAGWLAGGGIEFYSIAGARASLELRYQRGWRDQFSAGPAEVTQQSVSCLLGLAFGGGASSGSNQVTSVVGRKGDRWLDTMRFTRIERATNGGKQGYNVTYQVSGHGTVVTFWSRDRIVFDNRTPGYRLKPLKLGKGRLWYPTLITRESLPRVHRGILDIEKAYAAQANGATSAMHGFAVVAGVGGAKPTLRSTGPVPRTTVPATQTAATRASTIAGRWVRVNESMSARAAAYQARFGRPGYAYVVNGVRFDGVRKGVLLEAKGPGYATFVKNERFQVWFRGIDEFLAQAKRQLAAASGTPVKWHFAEETAAKATQALFRERGITSIHITFTP